MEQNFFISENDFRVWLPDVQFIQKSNKEDEYNSRQITGIMSSQSVDRQGESVVAKGLDFQDFLKVGHFNDNHSQDTSSIVGYPESVEYHKDISVLKGDLKQGTEGWTCKGYIVKGTKRADGIWELAKALQKTPDRRLGFSIEGKVKRRANKVIEKAKIRNVAITNCPVNTEATWEILTKSFYEEDIAMKSLSAGCGASPASQSGGGALRSEDLESDVKDNMKNKKDKKLKALIRALELEDLVKAMDIVLETQKNLDEDDAANLITYLYRLGR